MLLVASSAAGKPFLFLSSARAQQVVAYAVRLGNGDLEWAAAESLPGEPGPIEVNQAGDRLYVGISRLPGGGAAIATLAFDPGEGLQLVGWTETPSRAAFLRLSPEGEHLLAAHYDAGQVAVYGVEEDGLTSEPVTLRATAPTPHGVGFDLTGRYVFVPHTDPNRVDQFAFGAERGSLAPLVPAFVDGPADPGVRAPRHYAQHPGLSVGYTANEWQAGITRWRFDAEAETLVKMETLPTPPPGFQGVLAASDVVVTPDGRYAYVSNRDLTSRGAGETMHDSVAAFSLSPETGALTPIGTFSTVRYPRSLCVDVTGRFLFVMGEESNRVLAHRIRQRDGALTPAAMTRVAPRPRWIRCSPRIPVEREPPRPEVDASPRPG